MPHADITPAHSCTEAGPCRIHSATAACMLLLSNYRPTTRKSAHARHRVSRAVPALVGRGPFAPTPIRLIGARIESLKSRHVRNLTAPPNLPQDAHIWSLTLLGIPARCLSSGTTRPSQWHVAQEMSLDRGPAAVDGHLHVSHGDLRWRADRHLRPVRFTEQRVVGCMGRCAGACHAPHIDLC